MSKGMRLRVISFIIGLALFASVPRFINTHTFASGAMLGGLVLSFLTFSLQGLQLGRPEALACVIEANLEEKGTNLLTWFGRRCVLFTRPAFLGYVILFFVLLGQASALLCVVAVGANLAWILNVYYSVVFRRKGAVGHAL